MLIKESFLLAVSSVKSNKMRSFLTMLGIIIGISSVIAINTIGSSVRRVVNKEFEGAGTNQASIYANYESPEASVVSFDVGMKETIEKKFAKEIIYMNPDTSDLSEFELGKRKFKLDITGVKAGFLKLQPSVKIVAGRMINHKDVEHQRGVIVIDRKLADAVGGPQSAIGKKMVVSFEKTARELAVIGVTETKVSAFLSNMGKANDTVKTYVPYTLFQNTYYTSMMSFYINKDYNQERVIEEVKAFIAKENNLSPSALTSESMQKVANQINQTLNALSLGIAGIAGIALLVGGIGIMNIMLVSVTERTREIGIRKSLGAKTGNILFQFLVESSVLSLIGGTIGILLGVGVGKIGASVLKVELAADPKTIIGAVVFSTIVGIFFGMYPAKKAAKLDPIEALRYE